MSCRRPLVQGWLTGRHVAFPPPSSPRLVIARGGPSWRRTPSVWGSAHFRLISRRYSHPPGTSNVHQTLPATLLALASIIGVAQAGEQKSQDLMFFSPGKAPAIESLRAKAPAVELLQAKKTSRCLALYGPGFAALGDSDTCIRIWREHRRLRRHLIEAQPADHHALPRHRGSGTDPRRHAGRRHPPAKHRHGDARFRLCRYAHPDGDRRFRHASAGHGCAGLRRTARPRLRAVGSRPARRCLRTRRA